MAGLPPAAGPAGRAGRPVAPGRGGTRPAARPRWRRPVLWAAALVGAAALLTLASPLPDPDRAAERCVYVFPLVRDRGLALGCDGFTFLRGAVTPSLLLEPTFAPPADFTYQSRPLHIGLAAVLGRVFQPVVGRALPEDARYHGTTPTRRFAGAYVAYVLLNAGLLVAAGLALHDALLGRGGPGPGETAALLAGLAVTILSPTVKAWLFTPHTILWGVTVPLWALALGRRVLEETRPGAVGAVLRAGAAAGLAALAYAFAALVPAVGIAALGLRLGRHGPARGAGLRWLAAAAGAAALFALPTLLWIGLSHALGGGYYHHEAVAYRQFRWLPEALAAGVGPAVADSLARAHRWLAAVLAEWAAPAGFLGALGIVCLATGGSLRAFAARARPLLAAAALVLAGGLAFWYLNGQMGWVRAATLAPVLQVVAAALALDLDRRAGRTCWTGLLAGASLGWGVAALLRPLP